MADHDEIVMQFCELTGSSADRAAQYLEASSWNISAAVSSYFADDEDESAPSSSRPSQPAPEPAYSGPRTLDGRPAPQSALASSSSASKKPAKKKGLATLSSLGGGGGGHDHDDDDDDEEEDDTADRRGPRDLFAGGEKSGLAVQDPGRNPADPQNVIKDILAKAKANAKRAPSSDEDVPGPSQSSNFRGAGTTVGGEGTESRTIPDPAGAHAPSRSAEELPVVTRTLHLWRDGFSIEDGPLRRYDDPEHAMDLQMIRTGRAPLHLMEVEHGQRCDVRLQQHEEDWHQLPRIYKPFGGQGRRLGSPVPGDGNAAPASVLTPAAPAISAPAGSPAALADVDPNQPSVAIRFQMPDGSRLPARFNLTHTVGDLYQFARSASAETRVRAFTVQSTFPTKEYTDHSQLLGEVDAFKRGGIAVVKWA
ncbi:hypothetical protein KVR01_013823 [Diaporthe batatas]|uniref:protein phosphatase regulator SHP1 n=1 Tax=Diaporthe batatas TaxID=748121 RepID=UPI001D03A252|nr:protein phosphatase regulator SHP1 [Diaporthe batatas]KAG8156288.1 hypothetical protein KVR01_013823 [Diaporthe batatas]